MENPGHISILNYHDQTIGLRNRLRSYSRKLLTLKAFGTKPCGKLYPLAGRFYPSPLKFLGRGQAESFVVLPILPLGLKPFGAKLLKVGIGHRPRLGLGRERSKCEPE
jgi:hypothetical protein